jgi:hypothetical protein
MNEAARSFCYALRLHGAGRVNAILNLLVAEKRSVVAEVLRELQDCSEQELEKRWREMRSDEQRAQAEAAIEKTGLPLDRLPAAVRRHLAQSF